MPYTGAALFVNLMKISTKTSTNMIWERKGRGKGLPAVVVMVVKHRPVLNCKENLTKIIRACTTEKNVLYRRESGISLRPILCCCLENQGFIKYLYPMLIPLRINGTITFSFKLAAMQQWGVYSNSVALCLLYNNLIHSSRCNLGFYKPENFRWTLWFCFSKQLEHF